MHTAPQSTAHHHDACYRSTQSRTAAHGTTHSWHTWAMAPVTHQSIARHSLLTHASHRRGHTVAQHCSITRSVSQHTVTHDSTTASHAASRQRHKSITHTTASITEHVSCSITEQVSCDGARVTSDSCKDGGQNERETSWTTSDRTWTRHSVERVM